MRKPCEDEMMKLEQLVDAYGIDGVLSALSDIMAGKAQHLAENWQDAPTAKLWLQAMTRIDTALAQIERIGI